MEGKTHNWLEGRHLDPDILNTAGMEGKKKKELGKVSNQNGEILLFSGCWWVSGEVVEGRVVFAIVDFKKIQVWALSLPHRGVW